MRKFLLLLCAVIALSLGRCTPRAEQAEEPGEGTVLPPLPDDFVYTLLSTQYSGEICGLYQLSPGDDGFSLLVATEDWVRGFVYSPDNQLIFALTQSGQILYFSTVSPSETYTLDLPQLEEGERALKVDYATEAETVFVLTNMRVFKVPLPNSREEYAAYPLSDELRRWTLDSFCVSPDGATYIVNPSSYEGYCFDGKNGKALSILPGSQFRFVENDLVVFSTGRSIQTCDLQTGETMTLAEFTGLIYGLSLTDDGYILAWTGKGGFAGGAVLDAVAVVDRALCQAYSVPLPCSEMRLSYVMTLPCKTAEEGGD